MARVNLVRASAESAPRAGAAGRVTLSKLITYAKRLITITEIRMPAGDAGLFLAGERLIGTISPRHTLRALLVASCVRLRCGQRKRWRRFRPTFDGPIAGSAVWCRRCGRWVYGPAGGSLRAS